MENSINVHKCSKMIKTSISRFVINQSPKKTREQLTRSNVPCSPNRDTYT